MSFSTRGQARAPVVALAAEHHNQQLDNIQKVAEEGLTAEVRKLMHTDYINSL